jgi:hypothetical protein
MPAVQDDEWVVAESYPVREMEANGVTPDWVEGKWLDVAEDMALIPENNVRLIVENGVCRVEVSTYLMECMRGFYPPRQTRFGPGRACGVPARRAVPFARPGRAGYHFVGGAVGRDNFPVPGRAARP